MTADPDNWTQFNSTFFTLTPPIRGRFKNEGLNRIFLATSKKSWTDSSDELIGVIFWAPNGADHEHFGCGRIFLSELQNFSNVNEFQKRGVYPQIKSTPARVILGMVIVILMICYLFIMVRRKWR